MYTVNAIVAVNADWGIGLGGQQTIAIPDDRRRFKSLTGGGVVIAGRKTFESLNGVLPNRMNIVLTRDRDFSAAGALILHSINDVLTEIAGFDTDKVFVIGGESIYRQFLPMCRYAYITRIEASPPSDTFFPNPDALSSWTVESCSETYNFSGVLYSFYLYRNNAVEELYV